MTDLVLFLEIASWLAVVVLGLGYAVKLHVQAEREEADA